ncbi:MAG TPA: two-component regulator propeller domain-containing protein [Flavobacteriales bacterium]|nr:two-component regulator propeller domain-containing protein [Flavobacteriales bacterium]
MRRKHGHLTIIALLIGMCACNGPAPTSARTETVAHETSAPLDTSVAEQISRYIRCMFQDRDGNLWFGTTTDGVVRYDGRSLDYFNAQNGFGSDWVNAIAQDARGDLWFATRDGAVRYDGRMFVRYTTANGLASDHIWSLLADRDGALWFGTYGGVTRYDGNAFTPFHLPAADLSKHPYYEDPELVSAIVQDRAGDIWFATKGGAYRYSASRLTRFAEEDGLCSDFVNTILQESNGRVLFGTRFGGVCTFDGHAMQPLLREELKDENVGMLFEQRSGRLWVGRNATGLCGYDDSGNGEAEGAKLICYDERDEVGLRVPFCMLEDAQGRLWLGTGEGLYRYVDGMFRPVTRRSIIGS